MSESNEVTLLKTRARLFEMSLPPQGGPGVWVERGQGNLKLMKSTLTERTRLVMTKERPTNDRMDVLLNQIVHWESNLLAAQSDDGTSNRAFVFEAEDYANAVKSTKSTYALRFKTSDLAEAFKVKYEEAQASNQVVLRRQQNQNLIPKADGDVKDDSTLTAGPGNGSSVIAGGPRSPEPAGKSSVSSSEVTVEGVDESKPSSTLFYVGLGLVVVGAACAVAFVVSPEATKEKVKSTIKDSLKKLPALPALPKSFLAALGKK